MFVYMPILYVVSCSSSANSLNCWFLFFWEAKGPFTPALRSLVKGLPWDGASNVLVMSGPNNPYTSTIQHVDIQITALLMDIHNPLLVYVTCLRDLWGLLRLAVQVWHLFIFYFQCVPSTIPKALNGVVQNQNSNSGGPYQKKWMKHDISWHTSRHGNAFLQKCRSNEARLT